MKNECIEWVEQIRVTKTAGLGCSENFVGQREQLTLNTFFDLLSTSKISTSVEI